MQVSDRLADLPVLVVGLVVAHQGRHGDAVDDARDRIKPRLPLAVVLAVVDEVAHVDEEIRSFIARSRILREVLPVRVVIRL